MSYFDVKFRKKLYLNKNRGFCLPWEYEQFHEKCWNSWKVFTFPWCQFTSLLFCFKQKVWIFLVSHVMLTFRSRFYWDHAILNFSSLIRGWEKIKIKHDFFTQIYQKNCLAQIQGSKITFLDKKCSHQAFSQG